MCTRVCMYINVYITEITENHTGWAKNFQIMEDRNS